jgi:hypothetical protein
MLGTPSSTSPGRSCPSQNAIGPPSVTHCEDWYNGFLIKDRPKLKLKNPGL